MNNHVVCRIIRTKQRKAAALISTILLATVLILCLVRVNSLTLTATESGQLLFAAPLAEAEIFSVSYTHSVNKDDVEEFYQNNAGVIYVTALHYSAFGAGMPQDPRAEGATSIRWENEMIIAEGYDIPLPRLIYNVGRYADHILHYRGQLIHLATLAQPGTAVEFQISKCSLIQCMIN